MNLCHFYRCEGFSEDFLCLNGRWKWKFTINLDDSIPVTGYKTELEFIDCRGKLEKIVFNLDKPETAEDLCIVLPITEQCFLIKCRYIIDDDTEKYSWSVMELDWSNGKQNFGTDKFESDLLENVYYEPYSPFLDRASLSNDSLNFLIYRKENNHWLCSHCKVHRKQLKFEQLGSTFELSADLFNCLDFNDNIIRGLSFSKTAISSFNLSDKKVLSPIQEVFNVPSSICLSLEEKEEFSYLPPIGAWTSKKLYLWSQKRLRSGPTDRSYSSTLYIIDLLNGITTQLPHIFDGQIRELFINDGNLIIKCQKYLRQERYISMAAPRLRSFFEFKLFSLPLEK